MVWRLGLQENLCWRGVQSLIGGGGGTISKKGKLDKKSVDFSVKT